MNIISGDNTPVMLESEYTKRYDLMSSDNRMPLDNTLQSFDESLPNVLYQSLVTVCQG